MVDLGSFKEGVILGKSRFLRLSEVVQTRFFPLVLKGVGFIDFSFGDAIHTKF